MLMRYYEVLNKGGQCPLLLYYAAGGGCNDITKRLLEKGYDSNERFGNLTALSFAVYNGQLETAKILLNKGADLDLAIVTSIPQKHLLFFRRNQLRRLFVVIDFSGYLFHLWFHVIEKFSKLYYAVFDSL